MKNYILICSLSILFSCNLLGQLKPESFKIEPNRKDINTYRENTFCPKDSLDKIILLENTVLKNLYSYRLYMIKDSISKKWEDMPNNYISDLEIFDSLIPDFDYKLELNINKHDYYGWGSYTYSFHKEKDTYTNGLEKYTSGYFNNILPYDNYFLAAIDSNTCEVKFLSGNLFLSVLQGHELVLKDTIPELKLLINYRLFQFQVKEVDFIKKRKESFYFTGYSDILGKKVLITVSDGEPDISVFYDPDCITISYYEKSKGKILKYSKRIQRVPSSLNETKFLIKETTKDDVPEGFL